MIGMLWLCVFAIFTAADGQTPLIRTENGLISGVLDRTINGRLMFSYLGIPYAQPPVGKLRFEEPRRLTNWWVVRKAHKYADGCIAYDNTAYNEIYEGFRTYNVTGSEDCLYLNVFTNEKNLREGSKNVIVFIHGGGFQFGEPNIFQGHVIMDRRDIIYVSIAYRLGVMGFISTGDFVAPGNMGLKDQVAALEWVQRNIVNFGGDPRKVTITGMSAGGASVHLMFMSPLTTGLFNKGYSYSGSALCPWVMWDDIPEKTRRLASALGCPVSDSRTLVSCLKQISPHDLVAATSLFKVFLYNPFTVFGPVVDVASPRPYITKHPLQYLKEGDFKDLPWVTGVTSGEGLYSAAEYAGSDVLLQYVDINWLKLAPHILFFNDTVSHSLQNEVAESSRRAFLGGEPFSLANVGSFLQMITDRLYIGPAVRAAFYMSARMKSPVYLYHFRYRGQHTTSEVFTKNSHIFGVGHADDQLYVYDMPGLDMRTTSADRRVGQHLVEVAESFAKRGRPPAHLRWHPFGICRNTSGVRPFIYLDVAGPGHLKMECDSRLGNLDALGKIFDPVEEFYFEG